MTEALGLAEGLATGSLPLRVLRGALGIGFLLAAGAAFSVHRRAIDWGLVAKGLGLQLAVGLLVLETGWGEAFFRAVNRGFVALVDYTKEGARFLFGALVDGTVPIVRDGARVDGLAVGSELAFFVLPTIIFFSSLMTLAYHLGLMQRVVGLVARLMQRSLGTSGAETTSAAGNIFIGMTEAPLLVKPFVEKMTMSELHTVMVGGFATVAGGVMAAYVAMLSGYFPQIAGHLLSASLMAAPAGIVISKVLYPETGEPATAGAVRVEVERPHVNAIDAASGGAADGLRLALNVGAMLLAFLALIALANGLLGLAGGLVGLEGLTLQRILGWAFAPVAWIIGVPWDEAARVGSLFGIKVVATEFVAFQTLAEQLAAGNALSGRSLVITTYALTGFASLVAIAIEIGGIGGIAPSRRSDLSRLGIRAMIGGQMATWMTACLAGVLVG